MTFQTLATNAFLFLAASSVDCHSSLVAAQNYEVGGTTGGGVSGNLADHGGSYTVCPQVPSLHCRNGSTCLPGSMPPPDARHSHLNLQTHEFGYHCDCLPGYVGHECQVEVDDCDPVTGYDPSDPSGALRSCYHGSKCRASPPTSSSSMSGGGGGGGPGGLYCDCESLNRASGPTAMKFAGIMCQHASTSMCAASLVVSGGGGGGGGGHSPNGQFCTNHGTCVRMVSGDEPHPGCVCKEGWTGERCEIEQEAGGVHVTAQMAEEVAASKKGATSAIAGNILFGCILFAVAAVAAFIPVAFVRARRARGDAAAAGGDCDSDSAGGGGKASRATGGPAVGVEALEADGSGTMMVGRFSIDDDEGDMELTEEDGAAATAVVPGIV
jgi:hypothetical protein